MTDRRPGSEKGPRILPPSQRPSWDLRAPRRQTVPLVFSSPHSGRDYPGDFVAASPLDLAQLRRSEDAFVDEIFAGAPDFGAPLLRALFPRAYVDANREPFELDPEMFEDNLPDYVRTRSVRITAGLGTVPRVVADGAVIHPGPLAFEDAKARIERHHLPYHRTLEHLLRATRERFGGALLVDCHSMPSTGAAGAKGNSVGARALHNVDVVLGDCHGAACAAAITDTAEDTLTRLGYRVKRNRPYAGGYITRYYGRPAEHVHALQIEINRALYMDETTIQRMPDLGAVIRDMNRLIDALVQVVYAQLEAAGDIADAAE
ncbi:MAG: N-formylglutamate amidohydrolase [Rhodospirillaceae bacterium]